MEDRPVKTMEIQCLCGAIVVRLSGKPVVQAYCHCDDCQVAHGAAYVATMAYAARAVDVVKGKPVPLVVKTAPRMRCAGCGTLLFTEIASVGLRSINAMLIPRSEFEPQFHLHCQHAVLPIVDDLPHYKTLPAAFGGTGELIGW
jgi:hypothetical protein